MSFHGVGRSQRLRRERTCIGACLVLLTLSAAACDAGSPSSALESESVTMTAYRATVAGGSADVSSAFSYRTGSGPEVIETGSGVFSWDANLGEMTSRTSIAGSNIVSTEIIDGHDDYSKLSVGSTSLGGLGATDSNLWTKTSWSGNASSSLFGGLLFGTPGPPSPGSLLQLLQSQASSISVLGTEPIDGVETTHYRAQLPLSSLNVGNVSPLETKQAEQILGMSALGIEFWVDSSQLLRRLTFSLTIHRIPSTPGTPATVVAPSELPVTMTETLDVSNYGVPVDVAPPPANEVTLGGTCQTDSNGFACQSSS